MEHFEELEWVIENLSRWNPEVHGDFIESPEFTSLWFLFYPRGLGSREQSTMVGIGCHSVPPPGELSFLRSDGSLIHSQKGVNADDTSIFLYGPQLEEVLALIEESEGGTLTLRYRFSSEEDRKQKLRTVIDVIDTTLEIDPGALGCVEISCFTRYQSKESHYVHLNSVKKGDGTELQIDRPYANDGLVQTCVNYPNSDVLEENEHVFRGKEQWPFFSVNDRELAERGATVLLNLKIINGKIHDDPKPSLCTRGVRIAPKKGACFPEQVSSESSIDSDDSLITLSKKLTCLLQDQELTDFQLKCDGVFFPVHRAVLSAGSPVFKHLLSSDMREAAASGSVDIEDLDVSTLACFLAFLYQGAVSKDLTAEMVLKLYYAADKYEVPTLKKECVERLCAGISVENVCDILSLADKHGDDHLTEGSHSFILKKYNEVLKSQEWMAFIEGEPLLAVKTLTHFAQKDNVKASDHQ